MGNSSETWVGVALGLVITVGTFFGGYKILGGGEADDDGGQITAEGDGTTGDDVAAPAAGGEAVSSNGSAQALRVVVGDSSTTMAPSTTEEPTTTESTTTTVAPTTAPPSTVAPTTEALTTSAEQTTVTEATSTTAQSEMTTTAVGNEARAFEQEVIRLTNAQRTSRGCPALSHSDKLHTAALAHSKDMFENDYFDHTSLDGSKLNDRIDRQGYRWRRIAENIAYGYRTAASVVDGWMSSKGHRDNILNCDLTEIGVGFHSFYWTQKFATPG